jgi:hypothetical protein
MLCPEKRLYVFENYRYIGEHFFAISGKCFVCLRKIWDTREHFLVCPEKFCYVCENYGILRKMF